MTPPRTVHVLLVDDDTVDIMRVERALETHGLTNPLHIARDGIEALALLRGEGDRDALPRPYVILLDLNMPRMNGMEFLYELRRDPVHHDAVVFILTTSGDPVDRALAYTGNVAGYIVKSSADEDLSGVIRYLDPSLCEGSPS